MFIYSKSSGLNNAAIGKLETPIKMIIEHESTLLEQQGGPCSWLFNVEKSNKFGETIINQTAFDVFKPTDEGAAAETDTVIESGKKFIEHVQFTKEFVITAEMMEDAAYGVAPEAKRRAQYFTRAYYKTVNKLCTDALASGALASFTFAGKSIDTTTFDGKPLFHNKHSWGHSSKSSGEQSNYYYGDLINTGSSRTLDASVFPEALYALSDKVRNMLDENGEPLGYTADTLVIPGNRPKLEKIVKTVCGSEKITGSGNNDINLHFGNWNVVVLPYWQATDDRMIVMSSEANKNLAGNMFFNRVPLTVNNWVDYQTGNYIWNGRCRFGVGFGSYKHAILMVDSASATTNADKLAV